MRKTRQKANQRWLILPDMQIPYHDAASIRAVLAYASEQRWDGCLILGDFLDLNELSHFNKGMPRKKRVDSLKNSYAQGNKVLDAIQEAVRAHNKKARFVFLEGNHEYRAEVFIDENEEFEGFLEVEENLRLAERGFEYLKSWSKGKLFKIGKAYFHHGLYTNMYHAKKMATQFGVPIFYGHTHDVQEFPVVLWGDNKFITGKSLGCLCKRQPWMRGRPQNWQQAFAVFDIFPDGYFQETTYKIFKHRFFADGKMYDGRG